MVKAILEGRKTQTRRVVKDPAEFGCLTGDCPHETQIACDVAIANYGLYECPYGRIGDRLWVRETWAWAGIASMPPSETYKQFLVYTTEGEDPLAQWRPSIHMPRWASRITLEVTDVRVQLLSQITLKDAIAEGVEYDVSQPDGWPIERFHKLWDYLNAKRGFGWSTDPWVWAITFKRL